MQIVRSVLALLLFFGTLATAFCSSALCQDVAAEKISEPPKTDEVDSSLLQTFAENGYRVKRGSRTVCEIWLSKDLKLDPEFKESLERHYPFTPGQLIGILHFPRRGSEFRDQTVSSGWYTLRFGLQPIDGNHVGTSPTRDFVLLVSADADQADDEWDTEELVEKSAEAAGSAHPAMICLQPLGEGSPGQVRHMEEQDWWVLRAVGQGKADGQPKEIPIDMVVVGHATE